MIVDQCSCNAKTGKLNECLKIYETGFRLLLVCGLD